MKQGTEQVPFIKVLKATFQECTNNKIIWVLIFYFHHKIIHRKPGLAHN